MRLLRHTIFKLQCVLIKGRDTPYFIFFGQLFRRGGLQSFPDRKPCSRRISLTSRQSTRPNPGSICAPITHRPAQKKPVSGSVLKSPQIGLIFENGQSKKDSLKGFFWQISCLMGTFTIRKRRPPEREYGALEGIIWGSKWAYFLKWGIIRVLIYGGL